MQEFSSIAASSYDAESLAPMLTEKSAECWAVVSIVAAGTNIVAYLSREGAETPDSGPVDDEAADDTDTAGESPAAAEVTDADSDPAAAAGEAAGWAAAPDTDVADLTAQVGADDTATGTADSGDQVGDAVVEANAAAESNVPAGWYADPSDRYELRYWDGNAWTEHVSRAGQQFTDPPVA